MERPRQGSVTSLARAAMIRLEDLDMSLEALQIALEGSGTGSGAALPALAARRALGVVATELSSLIGRPRALEAPSEEPP